MAVTEIKDKSGNVIALDIFYSEERSPLTLTLAMADNLHRALSVWRKDWKTRVGRYRFLGKVCVEEGCTVALDDRSVRCYEHRFAHLKEAHDDGKD